MGTVHVFAEVHFNFLDINLVSVIDKLFILGQFYRLDNVVNINLAVFLKMQCNYIDFLLTELMV